MNSESDICDEIRIVDVLRLTQIDVYESILSYMVREIIQVVNKEDTLRRS